MRRVQLLLVCVLLAGCAPQMDSDDAAPEPDSPSPQPQPAATATGDNSSLTTPAASDAEPVADQQPVEPSNPADASTTPETATTDAAPVTAPVASDEPTPANPAPKAQEQPASPIDRKVVLEIIDTPLADAVQFLAAQSGMKISIATRELASLGLSTDEPVSVMLKDISLGSALNVMLQPLDLTWKDENGELIIRPGKITPRPAGERVTAALNEKTTLQFVQTPLKDVARFLSQSHRVPVILDETRLAEAGMSTDLPVTVNAKDITLREGLKQALGGVKLRFVAEDEVLKITTNR